MSDAEGDADGEGAEVESVRTVHHLHGRIADKHPDNAVDRKAAEEIYCKRALSKILAENLIVVAIDVCIAGQD